MSVKLSMKFKSACIVGSVALGLLSGCSSTPDKKEEKAKAVETTEAEPKTSAQELFIQGNKKLDEKDFPAAIALYDKALERDDQRWDIYMNKAIAHSAKQQFSEAIAAMDRALATGGDKEAQVYFNLGNIYQNRGLYAQSIKAYKTSLAVGDGQSIDTLVNLGGALALMREYDKAVETYNHIRSLAPDDPRPYVGMGVVEQARDNNKLAVEFYEQAQQIDPDFEQAWYNHAAVLADMKRYSDAAQSYRRYLELAPDGPYAKRARASLRRLKSKN
ncbi:tetratricopeptide repeat protein [Persicimonas caeni]|uniref:Tetratricopeptide repeat protein n=2 Tax=Persicimonas caeni TaxID=2292766 RepID=A0A4Y6Q0C8_PERCE|nr:tetratricopeptide repeat protein [Persicimonas caeni]QED35194.1 tetratricopeptide repeat protein [Persicimonas caeni]